MQVPAVELIVWNRRRREELSFVFVSGEPPRRNWVTHLQILVGAGWGARRRKKKTRRREGEEGERERERMCPLRIILVFLSATLAGYFAWRSVRSPAPSPFDVPVGEVDADESASEKTGRFQMGKVASSSLSLSLSSEFPRFSKLMAVGPFGLQAIEKGFWVFVDMASGRYLWRNLGAAAAPAAEPAKDSWGAALGGPFDGALGALD